jgi:hypothetical protein
MKAWRSAGGITVSGRVVIGLDWDTGAPKASFRAGDGRFYNKTEEGTAAVKALPSSSKGVPLVRGKGGRVHDAGAGAARDDTAGAGPESEPASEKGLQKKKAKYANRKAKAAE